MQDTLQLVEKLKQKALSLSLDENVYTVSKDIIEDEKFRLWSGSSKNHQHHYGKGGLINHTFEVIDLCFIIKHQYPQYSIDSKELFLAALYHDVGKMYDYEPLDLDYQEWGSKEHKRMIHHISRSAIIWSENAKKDKTIYKNYYDNVLHAILAHHGQRTAGSPVAPKSRVAWLVYLCDNISSRMYDADTWDIIKRPTT